MALTKARNRMIESAPVSPKDFGAVGDGVADDTAALKAAIKYLQNDQEIDPARTYSTAELDAIKTAVNTVGDRPQKMIIDGRFRYTEPLVIIGGFEISQDNSYGAYVQPADKFCLSYEGATGDKIAIQTALFEQSGSDWILVKTLAQIRALAADTDTILSKLKRISDDITWSFSHAVANGTYVGCLFDASKSRIHDAEMGMLGANADIAFICINTWQTKYERIHMYGRRQSVVGIRTNSSAAMVDIYTTTIGAAFAGSYEYMAPASSSYADFANQIVGSYFKHCQVRLDGYVTEHGNASNHIVCDYKSDMTIENPYFETSGPSHNNIANVSCYNDSMVRVYGGFMDKSNSNGFALYLEDCDSGRPSTMSTSFPLSGGYLVKTVNSSADVDIEFLGSGGTDNWGRSLTDGTGTTDLSKIRLKRPELTTIRVDATRTDISTGAAATIEDAIQLCNITGCRKITLDSNVTLTANIDMDEYKFDNIFFALGGYTLNLAGYRFNNSDDGVLSHIYMSVGTIVGTATDTGLFMVNAGAIGRPINVTTSNITYEDYFWLWGTGREAPQRCTVTLNDPSSIADYDTVTLAGATNPSICPIYVFYGGSAASAAGFTTPISNMSKGTFYTQDDL